MRPRHCTPLGLRPAISPNVGNSGAEFLVVGVRVRATPDEINEEKTCFRPAGAGSDPRVGDGLVLSIATKMVFPGERKPFPFHFAVRVSRADSELTWTSPEAKKKTCRATYVHGW